MTQHHHSSFRDHKRALAESERRKKHNAVNGRTGVPMNSIILQLKPIRHNPSCYWRFGDRCNCENSPVRYWAACDDTERRYRQTLQRNATLIERSAYTDFEVGGEVEKELWRLQDGWCIQLTIYNGRLSDPELISPDQAKETLQRSKCDAEKAFEEAKALLEQAEGALAKLLNP